MSSTTSEPKPDATTTSEDAADRGRTRSGDRRPRTGTVLWGVRGVALAAAALSLLSDAAPTGLTVVDGVWRAAGAAALAFACSRATRAPLLWMAAVTALAAVGGDGAYLAVPALVLVLFMAKSEERSRLVGAAVGALTAGALLLLPTSGPLGTQTLIALVAVVPILPAAYRRSPGRLRRDLRRGALVTLGVLLVVGAAAAAAMAFAAGSLEDGADKAQDGLRQVANGEGDAASETLGSAADDLEQADGLLSAPWLAPARVVPVLSQHVRAAADLASSGAELARRGKTVSDSAPYHDLRSEEGEVDLGQLARMEEPLDAAAASLRDAARTADAIRSPWLLPPLTDAIDEFSDEVADARPDAELAAEGVRVAPSLLGADGPRRYLVLLTTPAETRNLGGFTGSYAVLEADGGSVDMARSGEIAELNQTGDPSARAIEGHEEFVVRYSRYRPELLLQNMTVSPDMQTTAEVAGSLYEQTTGEAVDGVVVADPFTLAAFLELAGPIDVPSVGFPLDSTNAAAFLLRDQYELFAQDTVRKDRLEDVGSATFDALTERTLPGPETIGKVLGPVVREKRLMFFPFDPDEQEFIDRVGALGRFAAPEASDLISVRTANLLSNKIDTLVHRTTTYDATYDARTGSVDATVTLVIRNEAPSSGLPAYVIGPPNQRYPQGTARVRAAVYTPLDLEQATLDGASTGIEPQHEVGLNVFSAPLTIPPGGEVTLVVHLSGTIDGMGDTYRLLASSQPLANPDGLVVQVRAADGAPALEAARGLTVEDGVARDDDDWATDARFSARFGG